MTEREVEFLQTALSGAHDAIEALFEMVQNLEERVKRLEAERREGAAS